MSDDRNFRETRNLLAATMERHGWAQRLGGDHVQCECGWRGTKDDHAEHRLDAYAVALCRPYEPLVKDILVHARSFDGTDGFVTAYLVDTGPIHRAAARFPGLLGLGGVAQHSAAFARIAPAAPPEERQR